jgi:PST family polysaccharide transporter
MEPGVYTLFLFRAEEHRMHQQKSVESLESSMAQAVAWNAAARWATQIVSWFGTMLVARLLTPYDYGIVGMAAVYLVFAILITQAGIGDAIIAFRNLTPRQVAQLNSISLFAGLALVGLSCALASPLASFFSAPPLRAVIMVSSTVCLLNAFQEVPKALLQREMRFKLLAVSESIRSGAQIIVTLLLAALKFRYWSLVVGNVFASAVQSLFILYWRRQVFAIPRLDQLSRELKFSLHALLSRACWYIYDNSDFAVAGRVLGEVPLGSYTVAWTIASAPVEKITNMVTGVTPAYFSAVQHCKSELRRYLLKLTEIISLVTLPASVGLALSADYLVPVLLGPKWYAVIGPLRLLGIFVAARSVTTIFPNLLTAIGDARFVMWIMIGSAVFMPIVFLIGARWGTNGIAAAWVFAYPVIAFPLYYRIGRKTELGAKEYIWALLPSVSGSLVMAVVVVLIRWAFQGIAHSPATLCLVVLGGAISYCAALYIFHRARIARLIDAGRRTMLTKAANVAVQDEAS